ncbi:protein ORF20 [Lake sturgeon herpesvirus]|nr:protein ORF20 [Lake sturgeon herpesvirus]
MCQLHKHVVTNIANAYVDYKPHTEHKLFWSKYTLLTWYNYYLHFKAAKLSVNVSVLNTTLRFNPFLITEISSFPLRQPKEVLKFVTGALWNKPSMSALAALLEHDRQCGDRDTVLSALLAACIARKVLAPLHHLKEAAACYYVVYNRVWMLPDFTEKLAGCCPEGFRLFSILQLLTGEVSHLNLVLVNHPLGRLAYVYELLGVTPTQSLTPLIYTLQQSESIKHSLYALPTKKRSSVVLTSEQIPTPDMVPVLKVGSMATYMPATLVRTAERDEVNPAN